MELWQIITSTILGLIGVIKLVYAFFTFREKGPILSNTYILATPKEREKLDKSAEYRLVTVVFGILGLVFLLLAIAVLTSFYWLYYIVGALIAFVIIYAIADAIKTETKR